MHFLNKFFKGIIWNQIGKIFELILGLFYSIFIIRLLTEKEYGIYSYAIGFISFLLMITSFGIREMLSKRNAELLEYPKSILKLINLSLTFRFIIAIFLSLFIILLKKFISKFFDFPELEELFIIIFILFLLQSLIDIYLNTFTSLIKTKEITQNKFLTQIINITATIIIYHITKNVLLAAFWGLIIGYSFSFLFYKYKLSSLLTIKNEISNPIINKDILKLGLSAWVITIMTFGLENQIDILLIGNITKSPEQISYYNVAMQPIIRLHGFLFGWIGLVLPVASEFIMNKRMDDIPKLWNNLIKFNIILVVPAFSFLVILANPIINLLFSSRYVNSIVLLQVFAISSIIVNCLGMGINTSILYAINNYKIDLVVRIFSGFLNIILDLIFIKEFQALGAIIASSFSAIFLVIIEYVYLTRKIKVKFPFIFFNKITFATLLGLVPLLFLNQDIRLLTGIIISPAIFFISLYIFKQLEQDMKDNLVRIEPKLGKILIKLF